MKCNRMEVWFELPRDDLHCTEWENLLVHAQSCPDCALYQRQRCEMLVALSDIEKPSIPHDLHQSILEYIDLSGNQETTTSPIIEWVEQFLRPVEIGLSLACICMIIALFTLDSPSVLKSREPGATARARKRTTFSVAQAPLINDTFSTQEGEKLAQVSSDEVAEFLKKLRKYREMHPREFPSDSNSGEVLQGRMVDFYE